MSKQREDKKADLMNAGPLHSLYTAIAIQAIRAMGHTDEIPDDYDTFHKLLVDALEALAVRKGRMLDEWLPHN